MCQNCPAITYIQCVVVVVLPIGEQDARIASKPSRGDGRVEEPNPRDSQQFDNTMQKTSMLRRLAREASRHTRILASKAVPVTRRYSNE